MATGPAGSPRAQAARCYSCRARQGREAVRGPLIEFRRSLGSDRLRTLAERVWRQSSPTYLRRASGAKLIPPDMEHVASIPFIALRALGQPFSVWIDEPTNEEPLPSSVSPTEHGTSPGTRVTMVGDETTDDE